MSILVTTSISIYRRPGIRGVTRSFTTSVCGVKELDTLAG